MNDVETLDQAIEWLAQNNGRIHFQKPDEYTHEGYCFGTNSRKGYVVLSDFGIRGFDTSGRYLRTIGSTM